MSELLLPNRKDLNKVFADQFEGMTLAVLEETRECLITQINTELTSAEREFLFSMKRLEPKWDLLRLPGVERLSGPQWKLYNLRKMDSAKRKAARNRFATSSHCDRAKRIASCERAEYGKLGLQFFHTSFSIPYSEIRPFQETTGNVEKSISPLKMNSGENLKQLETSRFRILSPLS